MTEHHRSSRQSFRPPSVPPRSQTPGPGMMVPYNTFYQRLSKSEAYPVYASKSITQKGTESAPPV